MELDYDTHLKPATQIKKAKGENAALYYLFELLSSNDWKYYDHWTILDKMAGYYKKASVENKSKIIEEFHTFLDGSKAVDYYAKVACYKRLAKIYEQEKKDDIAFQMLSGAAANNHPEHSNYLFESADISLTSAQILARKDLSEEKNAIDYLYWHLTGLLQTMAWYKIFPNDQRPSVWKSNINSLFPFEITSAFKAFNTLSKNKSVEPFALRFQELVFDTFPKEFENHVHQTEALQIINRIIDDYFRLL
jgi:hypothetical protein